MAKFGFDSTEVDVNEKGSFGPVPEGEYTLKALEAESMKTKSGDGLYIKVKFEITKGEFATRWVWMNFNIDNPSEKAQKIGRQQLVAWATACGRPDADDTDKLLDRPFNAAVGIEPARDGYAASNKIKAFLFDDVEPKTPAKPAVKAAAPKASAPAGKSANPWDD